jgi:hypothetical protein
VDRDVSTALEQAALDVGGEPALAFELIDRGIDPAVTLGADDQGLHVVVSCGAQALGRQGCLSQRKCTASGRQPQRRSLGGRRERSSRNA